MLTNINTVLPYSHGQHTQRHLLDWDVDERKYIDFISLLQCNSYEWTLHYLHTILYLYLNIRLEGLLFFVLI